jgi:arginyl-tRNA synthetase
VIEKSDGAYLYSTTDLAAIRYRVSKYRAGRILYVVDNGQSLHFEQLFYAARELGYLGEQQAAHVKFGLILGEDMKKLSTREGRRIALDEVLQEAVARARIVVDAKRQDLPARTREQIAQAVGVAAVKYNDLSQNRQSDIAFRWEKMLSLEGDSAPYLMYTYARLASILRKGRARKFDAKPLTTEVDFTLARTLFEFPDVIHRVTETYFPHFIAQYLCRLAKAVNRYYQEVPVQGSPEPVRSARLHLVRAAASTLETGLSLLGIPVLEKM